VDGRGWGHGVGMAQDGAYWMAVDGASMDEILDHFYPGASRGSNTGAVRVVVLVSPDNRAVLDFPQGGEVRSPRSGAQRPGFPVRINPGGAVTVVWDGGSYRVEPAAGAVAAASAGQVGGRGVEPVQLPGSGGTTTTTAPGSTTSTTSLFGGVVPSTTTTAAPPMTTTTAPPSSGGGGEAPPPPPTTGGTSVSTPDPVWAGPVSAGGTVGVPARGLRYRGEIEVSAAGGPLRVIDELDIEQYLWGLAEVPASFPPAALQAQIVAARTYALRAMAANGEICDTQRCQVYKGASGEFRQQIDAVSATLGTTLGYGGRFASAVFSANAAGFSATPSEGFGTPDSYHPYLVAAPYETRSPDPWQVRIGLEDLARRLRYPGSATSARVSSKGPSGRPLEVTIDGSSGPFVVPALEVDAAMGLRSTMWSMALTTADAAPDAPEAEALIQAAPEDVGKVIAEETALAERRFSSSNRATTTTLSLAVGPLDRGPGDSDWPGALLVLPVLVAGAIGLVVLKGQSSEQTAPVAARPRRERQLRAGD
jgi:stage II sporulation protein D